MHFHHNPWGALAMWALAIPVLSLPAAAQTPPTELSYRPALQDHQRYTPTPVASWPQANQAVHERGGWRAYAREAAAAAASGAGHATTAPAAAEHGHHHPMPASTGGPAR